MLRYNLIENVFVFCSLKQQETNRFIKAFIYKTDGSHFFGGDGSIALTHIERGLYKSSLTFVMPVGKYKVLYVPYLDSGFTIADNLYGTKEETLEIYSDAALDISNIETKIDALSASVNEAEFDIQIQDDETVLEISVEEDSEIDLEIEE